MRPIVLALLATAAPGVAMAQDALVDEVIVTGTRVTGLRAVDSPTPIQVVSGAALERSVAPDLVQSLALVTPSFNAQAVAGDTANLTLSARLRGLSPNHTLVLINGKRRHGTANLAILSGAYQGGAAADLNLIPASAIERIEVLQDGAAAQYGSDAIAGVINIILKSADSGGSVTVTGGQYFDGEGQTGDLKVNAGFSPLSDAFLNLTYETRYHDYSNSGGPDQRVEQAINSGANPEWAHLTDYPYVNKIFGDARYQLNLLAFNAGATLGGVEAYAFGTYGRKYAAGWANFRLPTRLPEVYPDGFLPLDTMKEHDFALTGGLRTTAGGWTMDLSSTFGRDDGAVNVTNSANVDFYADFGWTPTAFHAGDFIASQWTTNLDATRLIDLGLAEPATLALGAEYRQETYEIHAGDFPSRYKTGSQSYPGFALTDAGKHDRSSVAVYADLALTPLPGLVIDIAGRHEQFSDFGDTTVGKLTGRYDVSSAFALRGTASTGFRAPTLAEAYYSATNVQPNSAFVQLPPNAAAAALIGISPLGPEKSVNVSVGLVARPAPGMLVTLDAYQIDIEDRVVGSGTLYGTYAGVVRSAAVNDAIEANGNTLEDVPFSGINVFSNGLDTRTRGAELVATWKAAAIDWTLAANYNETEVTGVRATPPQLAASNQSLFDKVAISNLEIAAPKAKVVLGGLWRSDRWSVEGRATWYGQSSRYSDPGDGNYYLDKAGSKVIADLSVSYRVTEGVTAQVGANNLFDTHPNHVNAEGLAASGAAGNPAVEIYPSFSPFGINGGFYYAKVGYRF